MTKNFNTYRIANDVRARFYCIYSLVVNHKDIYEYRNSQTLNYVFDSLLEFIWIADIGKWHQRNNELRPWVVLDEHPDALNDLEFITEEFHAELKSIYLAVDENWIKYFDDLYWYTFDCMIGNKEKSDKIFEALFFELTGKKPL